VIGEIGRAGAHAVVGGMFSYANGGSFWTGAATSFASSLIGSATHNLPALAQIGVSTITGGVTSKITGGTFWQGAANGLMVSALNHATHLIEQKFSNEQLKKIFDVYRDDMSAYPSAEEFYESIGGPLGDWAKRSPKYFQNTCAARLSKALNYSGFEIPKGTPNTYLGGDGKYYFIKAQEMSVYLSTDNVWGEPKLLLSTQRVKNAVIYQTGFNQGITGHLDVIYRGIPANYLYNTTTYWWH